MLAGMVLVSYPFFFDVSSGNLMVFVLLAGTWAIRGNRVAIAAYLLLAVLIPRPLTLPLAAWLLWKRPAWRLPAALVVLGVMASTAALGYGSAWADALTRSAGDVRNVFNLGPTGFIGPAWLLVGIPLGVWLTFRGRLGWASLAISPYLLPYYYLMLGLEVAPGRGAGSRPAFMTALGALRRHWRRA